MTDILDRLKIKIDADSRDASLEIERLRAALKPFAGAAFNDNGDVTIDTSHIKTQDWLKAKAAIHGK